MTPERWQQVKAVLAGALERAPQERHAYLDQVCTEPDLRREVESLLAAQDGGAGSFLEHPAVGNGELGSGARLGPYEILARLGSGGMGVVYRARDTKLGRDVAVKVLPPTLAHDADRMARFQREAKVLASLSHPNIATIYGLEESGGTRAIVMELVEGPTLADRISRGPVPLEEALLIVRQIAEALEAAHERGVVHRDLKPANVKLTKDGAVKVLDFGLAKVWQGDASRGDLADSPTLSDVATQAGVLLGTAAYMSPEQAKGKAVDRRADIWAFGCVLYEMLTGRMAFGGETVTDTLAAVIKGEPDWTQLPGSTPVRVRVLLQRCLQKDPRQRLRDIGDARLVLEEVLSGAPDPTSAAPAVASVKQWQLWLTRGAVALLALVAAWLAFLYQHQKLPPSQVMRSEISAPEKTVLTGSLALSPDGRELAFTAAGADGQTRVWVRSLDTLVSRPLEGTEGAERPFWSPDSRFIAFSAQGKLKKINSAGGPAVALGALPGSLMGGAWSRDDRIVVGLGVGMFQISASGGSLIPIVTDRTSGASSFLPDGRHFLYWLVDGIYVGSIGVKPDEQPLRKLLDDFTEVLYVPSEQPAVGRLLFVRGAAGSESLGTLMAQPFDMRRLELTGEAVPVAEKVLNFSFSASTTDVLVYLTGFSMGGQLTWFDREGKVLETVGDPGVYGYVVLSPDGKRVAFSRSDSERAGPTRNIWFYEFARGVTTRFTFDSGYDEAPVWSPDGSRIAFSSTPYSNGAKTHEVYQKAASLAGEDELLLQTNVWAYPTSWSPDGRFLLYWTSTDQFGLLPLGGGTAERKLTPQTKSEFGQGDAHFSPDGRWIAYQSGETGRHEIYVRPFDAALAIGSSSSSAVRAPAAGKWMVSKDGGSTPRWRRDGKELFYLSADGVTLMAVDVSTTGMFEAGIPKPLFKAPHGVQSWDVTADGKRFLMPVPSAPSTAAQASFTVVLNWQAGLKK